MDRNMGAFVEKAANGAPVKSTPQLNNVLMQLRKNCNHPDLITSQMDGSMEYPSAEELVAQCGKFRLMDRLLTQLKAKGHKVLIFSQMTRMLDLISVYLESKVRVYHAPAAPSPPFHCATPLLSRGANGPSEIVGIRCQTCATHEAG
jgi:hypothetical protein